MADAINELERVSDVYATALFALAQDQGMVLPVRGELEDLVSLTGGDRQFAAFLASTSLDVERRAASLERIFRGQLSDAVLNTLLVMNRNGRIALLPHLLRQYVIRLEDAAGEVEVRVTSAVELDAGQRDAITVTAGSVSGKRPVMEYRIDADIIGGLIVEIGNVRYDHSARRHLHVLRERLLERSARGLSLS